LTEKVAKEGARELPNYFFLSQRRLEKKCFCKRAGIDRKEVGHEVLLSFFSIRMPHQQVSQGSSILHASTTEYQ